MPDGKFTHKNDRFSFFENNKLNVKWVSEYAQDFAEVLDQRRLNKTQLRAFYNEFLRIRDLSTSFDEKLVLIKLLSAKANYRKVAGTIPVDMLDFMQELVEQIGDSPERFASACYIMEAIVGFFPKKS